MSAKWTMEELAVALRRAVDEGHWRMCLKCLRGHNNADTCPHCSPASPPETAATVTDADVTNAERVWLATYHADSLDRRNSLRRVLNDFVARSRPAAAPETAPEWEDLITELHNASFNCGAYDADDDEETTYEEVHKAWKAAEAKFVAALHRLTQERDDAKNEAGEARIVEQARKQEVRRMAQLFDALLRDTAVEARTGEELVAKVVNEVLSLRQRVETAERELQTALDVSEDVSSNVFRQNYQAARIAEARIAEAKAALASETPASDRHGKDCDCAVNQGGGDLDSAPASEGTETKVERAKMRVDSRLVNLLEAMRDGEPDDYAADSVTCWELWKHEAKQLLKMIDEGRAPAGLHPSDDEVWAAYRAGYLNGVSEPKATIEGYEAWCALAEAGASAYVAVLKLNPVAARASWIADRREISTKPSGSVSSEVAK